MVKPLSSVYRNVHAPELEKVKEEEAENCQHRCGTSALAPVQEEEEEEEAGYQEFSGVYLNPNFEAGEKEVPSQHQT